jgi:YD repeat-containing protein
VFYQHAVPNGTVLIEDNSLSIVFEIIISPNAVILQNKNLQFLVHTAMKKIMVVIGLVIAANTVRGQGNYGYSCFDPINKIPVEEFKGRIKRVKLTSSEGDVYVREYDKNGRLIREKVSDTLGYRPIITLFTYDSTGRITKQEYTYRETNGFEGNHHYITVYAYDLNGRLIQEFRYNVDKKRTPIYRSRFVYDNEGRLIQKTWNASKQMWAMYDRSHDWIEIPLPNAPPPPNSSNGNFKYRYNTRHQLVQEECLCDGFYDNQTMTYKFSYRDTQLVSVTNGKEVDSFIYDGSKLFLKWVMTYPYRIPKEEHEYDSTGRLIKRCYEDGMLDEYIYDEKGNLSKIESYEHGILHCVESFYKYDAHGNYGESRLYFIRYNETRTTRVELSYYE